ncbi:hypothetical protein [Nocardia sp. NPDC051463]|uniref:hypothetical protein n=1 Tax=Nocardia sp. NPDC051463 TaxID=3154845 RepID=UPI0034333136
MFDELSAVEPEYIHDRQAALPGFAYSVHLSADLITFRDKTFHLDTQSGKRFPRVGEPGEQSFESVGDFRVVLDVPIADQCGGGLEIARESAVPQRRSICFADRDALVLAALEQYHGDLVRAIEDVEAASDDPVETLRTCTHVLGA